MYEISWAKSHAYEYEVFDFESHIKVLFRTLPMDVYTSYEFLFKKAGLSINSIQSELLAFSWLFNNEQHVYQIFISENKTFLLEYKDGIYKSHKKFNFSYNQLVQDIMNNLLLKKEDAEKILFNYGVLQTHKDRKVIVKIERSISPLFDFIMKRKSKEKTSLYIHFERFPIKGFSDKFKKAIKTDIHEISLFSNGNFFKEEILSLHKNDSYQYEPLLARALGLMQ
jgi:hypothetical protein